MGSRLRLKLICPPTKMSALAQIGANGGDLPILGAAFDACPEPLGVAEGQRLVYSNASFIEMLGYSGEPAGLQDVPLRQLFPGEVRWLDEPASVGIRRSRELRAVRRDGTSATLRLSCALFRLGSRELLILSASRPPAAASATGQSQQLESLGRLAGAVAHDFNNLLTGVLLYCDLLKAGLENQHQLRGYVAEIRRAGEHSAELVQQLMAVARPGREVPGAHSWREVVSAIHNLLGRLVGESIELQTELGPSAACIRMEPAHMRQIVLNLLLNARDAMPGGGRIILTAAECPCEAHVCVALTVEDHGCGMDEETRSHLFETFFTTKQPGRGTGLGLSTIHQIVHEHGGEIRVQSEPGRGTRMSVHLPRFFAPGEVISITQERKDNPL
jgi:signal transduction histidine kinase